MMSQPLATRRAGRSGRQRGPAKLAMPAIGVGAPAADGFYLTFNKPARALLDAAAGGEVAHGLHIKLHDDAILFKNSPEPHGKHIAEVSARPRGGYKVALRGHAIVEYVRHFERLGLTAEQPYFTLYKATKGWLGVQHWPADGRPVPRLAKPLRTQPHVRVWLPRALAGQPAETQRTKAVEPRAAAPAAAPRRRATATQQPNQRSGARLVHQPGTARFDTQPARAPAKHGTGTPRPGATRNRLSAGTANTRTAGQVRARQRPDARPSGAPPSGAPPSGAPASGVAPAGATPVVLDRLQQLQRIITRQGAYLSAIQTQLQVLIDQIGQESRPGARRGRVNPAAPAPSAPAPSAPAPSAPAPSATVPRDRGDRPARRRGATITAKPARDNPTLLEQLAAARRIVQNAPKRPGRPARAVQEAKALLAQYPDQASALAAGATMAGNSPRSQRRHRAANRAATQASPRPEPVQAPVDVPMSGEPRRRRTRHSAARHHSGGAATRHYSDPSANATEPLTAPPDQAWFDPACADQPATTSDHAIPDHAIPDHAIPDDALADDAIADDPLPAGALPDDALPDDALPDDALPDHPLPDHPDHEFSDHEIQQSEPPVDGSPAAETDPVAQAPEPDPEFQHGVLFVEPVDATDQPMTEHPRVRHGSA